jgi:hypothetical protein
VERPSVTVCPVGSFGFIVKPNSNLKAAPSLARPRGIIESLLIIAIACFLFSSLARAQEEHRNKLPGISKITSNGPTRQAFTGSVQLLDTHQRVLNVTAAGGGNTAIFPIGKKVKVSTIDGQKLRVATLTPGTNVIVYYEQKGGRRTVDQIIVLGPHAPTGKKKDRTSS